MSGKNRQPQGQTNPVAKLQEQVFGRKSFRTQSLGIKPKYGLHQNIMEIKAREKNRKRKRALSTEQRPGSEAFWNPDAKHKLKTVKNVVRKLREKREEIENQLDEESEDETPKPTEQRTGKGKNKKKKGKKGKNIKD